MTIVGDGVVDNVSHGKGALVNKGTANLEGGHFTRSAEAGTPAGNGGNSWYVIDNHGTMVIDGAKVTNTSGLSSLIRNIEASFTMESGFLENAFIALKNDDNGTVAINGGTISTTGTGGSALQNWGQATVSGGTLTAPEGALAIYALSWSDSYGSSSISVNEGATVDGDVLVKRDPACATETSTIPSFALNGGKVDGDITAGKSSDIALNSGTVTGELAKDSSSDSSLVVSGGVYADPDVAKYLAFDAAALKKADGSISVADEETIKKQAAASVTVTKDNVSTTTYYEDKAEAEEAKKEAEAAGAQVEEKVFKCTVTFDYGTGEKTTAVVENGGVVAKPADPTYEGWTFVGWFSDADFKNAYDFATPVTSDITIYAGWNEVPASSTDEPAATADVKKSSSAKTGDTNLFVPVAAVAGIAAAVALGAVAYRRKMQ